MNKFTETIKQFKSINAIVIGDIMLDEHLWCKVSRISPEAPVPVAQIEKVTEMPGGAGNVANNIKSLGAKVDLVGVVGKDSAGNKLINALKHNKIGCKNIIKEKTRATTLKSRIIAHHQHVVRVDRDDNKNINSNTINKIINQYRKDIQGYDAVIISDYAKSFLNDEFCKNLISIAKKYNKIVVIDPKGISYDKYKNATVITPNIHELEKVINKTIINYKMLVKSAVKLKKKLNLDNIIITQGEEGMTLIDNHNKDYHLSAYAKDVYDITGAGDTVVAVLSLSLASGLNIIDAAKLANHAAGIVVGKVGTSVLEPQELISVVNNI